MQSSQKQISSDDTAELKDLYFVSFMMSNNRSH